MLQKRSYIKSVYSYEKETDLKYEINGSVVIKIVEKHRV